MTRNAEKNSPQKTLKVCSQKKIMIVSKIILFNKHSQSKAIFLGALLQTATMLSFTRREETVKITSASNAKKSIAWIANLMHTRGSRVRNLSETEIQISSIEPLSSLWRVQSSSNAPIAPCGSKRQTAVPTWDVDVALNSAIHAGASIWSVLATVTVPKAVS